MGQSAVADVDVEQEIQRNYRWNFSVNMLDTAGFWLAMSFFSSTVVLPLFVSHLTESPLAIGLISFIGWGGFLLPQVFAANAVERAPRKKFFAATLSFFLERLPIMLLGPLTYLLRGSPAAASLWAFFALYAWHNIGSGVIAVGWQDMIAKIIPVEKRGRFFGISSFIGNGAGVLGALAVPVLLGGSAFPIGFAACFAAAGVMMFVSWLFVTLTREPAVPNKKPPVSQIDYLRSLPGILRSDRDFRTYLTAQIVFSFSGMASGFMVVYARQTWNLPDAQAGGFAIALQIGMAAGNLLLGFLSDRFGHKWALEVCALMSVAELCMAILAPAPAWFLPVFFLRGAIFAGSLISGNSIVYEFVAPDSRPTYIGLASAIPGVAVAAAPLIGGWLAAVTSYPLMFGVAAVCGAAGWLMLRFWVPEPRRNKGGA